MADVEQIYYSEDGLADAYIRALDDSLAEVGPYLGIDGISDISFTRETTDREILANNRTFKEDSKFKKYTAQAKVYAKRMDMMQFYQAGTMTKVGNTVEYVEDPDGLPKRFALYVTFPMDGENGEPGVGFVHYPNCRAKNLSTPRQTAQYAENTLDITCLVGPNGYPSRLFYDYDKIGLNVSGDTTAPTISSSTPTNGATDVAVDAALSVVFDLSMNESSLSNIELYRLSTGAPVAGTVTYDSGTKTATFTPSASMTASEDYMLRVPSSVRSAVGNRLAVTHAITFTTAA